jgi:hypothetical protein
MGTFKSSPRPSSSRDSKTRDHLACLYGLARDDVDYIMETFPIVKRKDEAAHGEYRTKRVILEIYDAMQRAVESGQPYQTLLDPLAADASVAHLPKLQA